MSKALKNAIAALRAKGTTLEEIKQMVEGMLCSTFVDKNNINEHLDDLVKFLPGWSVVDKKLAIIVNDKGQQIWFGVTTNNQLHVSQYKWKYSEGMFGPPAFATAPLSVQELAEKVLGLEKRLTPPS